MNYSFLTKTCLISCFVPSYVWYTRRILSGGESALSVVLLPLVLWLGSQEANRETPCELLTTLGIVGYILMWSIPMPAMIKALLAITVLLYHFGLLKNLGVSSLSYLTLPWLDSLQFFLGYPLRRIVAEICAHGLQLLQFEVTLHGTGLLYQGQHVFVDPPCSGVKMLWAGTVLCAALIALLHLNWRQALLLYGISGVLLILGNAFRGIILFFPESHLVHWPAWVHEGVGLLIYAFCVYGLITLSQNLTSRT